MSRDEFLTRLYDELGFLPPDERDEKMRYFRGHMPETPEEIAVMFGTPRETAERVFRQKQAERAAEDDNGEHERYDFKILKEEKKPTGAGGIGLLGKVLIGIAAVIFLFPIAAAASLAALGVLGAVLCALLMIAGLAVALLVCGIGLVVTCFSASLGASLLQLGLGLVFTGAGALAVYFGGYALIKGVIALVRALTEFVSHRINRRGGRV